MELPLKKAPNCFLFSTVVKNSNYLICCRNTKEISHIISWGVFLLELDNPSLNSILYFLFFYYFRVATEPSRSFVGNQLEFIGTGVLWEFKIMGTAAIQPISPQLRNTRARELLVLRNLWKVLQGFGAGER